MAEETASEMVDGAMLVIGERCYFIPRDDLRSYRVPDDVAGSVLDEIQGVEGDLHQVIDVRE